jgi:hypothetical protein
MLLVTDVGSARNYAKNDITHATEGHTLIFSASKFVNYG